MEERQPPGAGPASQDQERVDEFEDLREVEHVGPEKCGPARRGDSGGEADGPGGVVGRGLVEGGEGAAHGHQEGENAENEVVDGGDEAEGGGGNGREEGEVVERECECEVGEDGGGDEL